MTKGTIHQKDKFLNHIASLLGRERLQAPPLLTREYKPQWEVLKGATIEELYSIFIKNSEEKGTNTITTNMRELSQTVVDVIKTYGEGVMVATDDSRFDAYGLTPVLNKYDVHWWDTSRGKENIAKAKEANIGFIFSDISLAESGTIVQFNDKDIARSVSLLPTTYVAIVPKSSIVPRMSQATKQIKGMVENEEDIASYINFISGPSNSADIEMNIVVGVHGPVKAVYIIVEDK
jgi:L-lactate dehydrogenase complex protein LldG